MKKELALLLLLFLFIKVSGQNSFEYTFTDNPCMGVSAFENNGRYYLVGSTLWDGPGIHGIVAGCTNQNDLIFKEITKTDTASYFYFGAPINNGNILVVGTITLSKEQLYVCEMDEELEIVNENYYDILPEGYEQILFFDMVVDSDSNLILAGHIDNFTWTMGHSLFLVRIDKYGNLIDFANLIDVNYNGDVQGDLLVKQDGSGYYYFNAGSWDWIYINMQLEYVTGNYFYPHFIGDPATAVYLPGGNIAFAGVIDVGTSYYDIALSKVAGNLQWIYDTAIVEPGRQCPGYYKGMDYTDPENIWLIVYNDWYAPTGTDEYKFYILDTMFNVLGSKYYGGDNDYTFLYLKATTDGGCIVAGSIRLKEGSLESGAILKKVMPEDILTGNDEKVFTEFRDVLVYPNPFTDKIFFTTDRDDLLFNLFDINGRLVYQDAIQSKEINELRSDNLQKGIYIYSITNSAGKAIDGGKLLKK